VTALRLGRALGLGAWVALMVACAARQAGPATPRSNASMLDGRPDELHARITELDRRIAAARDQLGTAAPDASATAAMSELDVAAAALTCTRSASETCTDVCTLGDSICDDAQSICEISAQLVGDAWAAERCDGGKASCKAASEKCCAC